MKKRLLLSGRIRTYYLPIGCSTAVANTPSKQESVGSNPIRCWAFFLPLHSFGASLRKKWAASFIRSQTEEPLYFLWGERVFQSVLLLGGEAGLIIRVSMGLICMERDIKKICDEWMNCFNFCSHLREISWNSRNRKSLGQLENKSTSCHQALHILAPLWR